MVLDDIDQDLGLYSALSAEEALELGKQHSFDLTLVDIGLPQMDGIECIKTLRSNPDNSSLPVIFVTAHKKEKQYMVRCYDAGAIDYVTKSFDTFELCAKIKSILTNERHKKIINFV